MAVVLLAYWNPVPTLSASISFFFLFDLPCWRACHVHFLVSCFQLVCLGLALATEYISRHPTVQPRLEVRAFVPIFIPGSASMLGFHLYTAPVMMNSGEIGVKIPPVSESL